MSARHGGGEHSREIDVTVLRAWISAGRPGQGPRDWYYRTRMRGLPQKRHRRATGPRWEWWPTLTLFVAVLLAAAGVGLLAVDRAERQQGVARWCISCHGRSTQGD